MDNESQPSANKFPCAGALFNFVFVGFPVTKDGGIEVGSVRPYDCVNFRIDSDLLEQSDVTKRAVHLTVKNPFEINHFLRSIAEGDLKRVVSENSDVSYFVNRMLHNLIWQI